MSLADVLGWTSMSKRDGLLTINKSRETKKIFIGNGNVVAVYSNLYSDKLANILVKQGKLDEEQAKKDINLNMDSSRMLGQILLNRGLVDLGSLFHAIQFQVENIVYSLFAWDEGFFLFRECEVPYKEIWYVNVGITNLVMEASRRSDEWRVLMGKFEGKWNCKFKINPNKKKVMRYLKSADAESNHVYNLIDVDRDLSTVVSLSSLSELDTLNGVLKLIKDKVISLKKYDPSVQFDQGAKIQQMINDGETYYSQGRVDHAIKSWKSALELNPNHQETKQRIEEAKKILVRGLISKIGSDTKIPKKRIEVVSLTPDVLYLENLEKVFFELVDNKRTLKEIAQDHSISEEEAYIACNRLMEMDYVYF